jgi:hypothetical protein
VGDGLVVFLDGGEVRLGRDLLIISGVIVDQEASVSASHSTECLFYGLNGMGKRKDDGLPECPRIGPRVQLLHRDLSGMIEQTCVLGATNDKR